MNNTLAGCTVLVMSKNVFDPETVNCPAPPWFNVQLYVALPPAKVLVLADVIEIVPAPVPATVVKSVPILFVQAPCTTIVPLLKVNSKGTPVLLSVMFTAVKVLPFKSNFPLLKYTTLELFVKASNSFVFDVLSIPKK